MTIVVVFSGQHFYINPNPAVVQSGDPVEWVLWYAGAQRTGEISWKVRFGSTPFSPAAGGVGGIASQEHVTVVSPDSTSVSNPQPGSYGGYPEGKINPGKATESGLYKYDIEVTDQFGSKLGEEDPYLLVQSAVTGGIP